MFYARPHVKPLGWDLQEMPVFDGSYSYDATTTDNRPVWFRYRGGWLQVARGEAGAEEATRDQIVWAESIGPPFDWGILAVQICEILQLTVQGRKIVCTDEDLHHPENRHTSRDFSGKTTYWESRHTGLPGEGRVFLSHITKAFPDTIILKRDLRAGGGVTWRELGFSLKNEQAVTVAIQPHREQLTWMLLAQNNQGYNITKIPAAMLVNIRLEKRPDENDLMKRNSADELTIKFETSAKSIFDIRVEFQTNDAAACQHMRVLVALIHRHFCQGLEFVDLATKHVLVTRLAAGNYSLGLRDWCLKNPRRFVLVSCETAHSRAADPEGSLGKGDKPLFFGARAISEATSSQLESLQLRADSGDADAQYRLGYMYATGQGAYEQDYVPAYYWTGLALKSGKYYPAFHEQIAFQLSPEQKATLDEGIASWVPK